MATLDAKHVFTGVASFRLRKPKSKQSHLHSFAPMLAIHNGNGKERSILWYT
jgi:hypothetical protein